MSAARNPLQLNLAHLGVTRWCALLGHACDGVESTCQCECHRS